MSEILPPILYLVRLDDDSWIALEDERRAYERAALLDRYSEADGNGATGVGVYRIPSEWLGCFGPYTLVHVIERLEELREDRGAVADRMLDADGGPILGPGERLIDGRVFYSAAWLDRSRS